MFHAIMICNYELVFLQYSPTTNLNVTGMPVK